MCYLLCHSMGLPYNYFMEKRNFMLICYFTLTLMYFLERFKFKSSIAYDIRNSLYKVSHSGLLFKSGIYSNVVS